jgi:hypothetical protein
MEDTDLLLICDQCGASARAGHTPVRDFAVVWLAATAVGWRGLDRPLGPHFCPSCPADGQSSG